METKTPKPRARKPLQLVLAAIGCAALLAAGGGVVLAQEEEPLPVLTKGGKPAGSPAPAQDVAVEEAASKLPPEQLDSLVAPIALYPDALLAQTLVASTYPLEIVQLQQWLAKNPDLKDKALADAVAKQPWDPSIQSMAAVPDVVKRLADDIQWTTDLGNAFLAQQADVMDAVQRMRKKAKDKGALESNEQQKVETQGRRGEDGHRRASPRTPRSSTCRPTARRSSTARPSIRIRRSTTLPTPRAPPS